MADPIVLIVTRDFAASPERVFDAWLDPAQAARFLFATPGGEMLQVEIDARIGGRALIVERRPGGDARHRLQFETIERPRRLVFLFAADPAEEGQWTRSLDRYRRGARRMPADAHSRNGPRLGCL